MFKKKKHLWSQDEIINAMEENMLFQMTYFAKHAPSLEIVPLVDVTVVKSDISDDTFNYVLAARFSKENVSDRVASILKLFKVSNIPFSWWVSQNDSPKNLSDFLLQQGLLFKEENIGMYLNLDDFQVNLVEVPLLFEKVTSVYQLKDFSKVIVEIGGNPEAFDKIYNQLLPEAYQYGKDFEMYVGYLNDEPVISGIVVFHADVAGIYYVATIPSQRKKGFGTAMMNYLLVQASNRGFHIATLQASKDGKSLYERMGFKACTLFREYTNHLKVDEHSVMINDQMKFKPKKPT